MKISHDTVIIVTGSTRGLGRVLLEDFANRDARVYGTYKSNQAAAKELETKFQNVHMYEVDNAKVTEIEKFVKEVIDKEGKVDILVNNAGAVQERKPLADLSLDNWNSLLAVHLTGAYIFCKSVLPAMKQSNQGLIINVTSRFGLFENAKAGFGSLNVAKAGLNMLTKVLFRELEGTSIRVNSVLPAPTPTDFVNEVFSPEEIAGMKQKGILGEPSEFVTLVNEVIADDSINGEFVLDKRLRNN